MKYTGMPAGMWVLSAVKSERQIMTVHEFGKENKKRVFLFLQ